MGVIELFEIEKLGKQIWRGPYYYDHPDGEDLPGKLQFTAVIASALGLVVGGTAACIKTEIPTSLKFKVLRTAQFLIPTFGVAMTFTVATYYSTRLRGKDDEYNYVVGGFLSGATLGLLTPYRDVGALAALIFFPAIGYYRKRKQLQGREMFSSNHYKYLPSYYMRNWNFSKIEERPGHWTREPVAK